MDASELTALSDDGPLAPSPDEVAAALVALRGYQRLAALMTAATVATTVGAALAAAHRWRQRA